MIGISQKNRIHHRLVLLIGVILLVVDWPITVSAQDATTKNSSQTNRNSDRQTAVDKSLAAQIRDLQIKMKKLEAVLKQKQASSMSSRMKGRSMKGMMDQGKGKKGGMGMASMSGQGTSGMGMKSGKKGKMSKQGMGSKGMSGMAMMGQMKGMDQMQVPSALPGFAGASHIYHIGATSFFLDHSQHITLLQAQQVKLNQIKEKVLLGQATSDRWISQAEQELWVLTSTDAPNATRIEAKIREIEKLRSDKRIAYIRAVGEAAGVLTDEQRQTLVGGLPLDHNAKDTGNRN